MANRRRVKISILFIQILFLIFSPSITKAAEAETPAKTQPDKKIKIKLEFRHRFESLDNLDFDSAKDDRNSFNLFRTRLGIEYTPSKKFGAFLQIQDSRISGEKPGTNTAPYADNTDISQLYIDLKRTGSGTFDFRLGRQALSYGDQRLIGDFNWSNIAQSFDAFKASYVYKSLKIDGLAARKVIFDQKKLNWGDYQDNLYGIYATYSGIKKHNLDFYLLLRDTEKEIAFGPNVGKGKMSEETIGFRLKGENLGSFDYTVESAFQFGRFGSQKINAHAVVALAGYTLKSSPWTPRLGIEWDYATGDRNPGDGVRNTFDNLFPTNHLFYGYMDRASLQNLNNLKFMISAKPTRKLYLEADLHAISLDTAADSLYSAARIPIRTSKNPGVSRQVGTELDFLVKYDVSKNLNFLVGYSHFKTGKFLQETGPANDADFFYLQTTISF